MILARLRRAGLTIAANGDTLTASPRAAITADIRAMIVANKPAILAELADEFAERVYNNGLELLTGMLFEEGFLPASTIASLRKYFPSIVGPRPHWIPSSDWVSREAHFCGLISQLGQTGRPPAALVRSIRRNESRACDVSDVNTDKKPKLAPWRLEARAKWDRIKKASRAESTRLKRAAARKRPRKLEPVSVASEPALKPLPMVPVQIPSIDAERRARLEQQLRAHPEQKLAFDVIEAPAQPEPGAPVSVARATRQGASVVIEAFEIERDRFDPIAFLLQIDVP